MPLHQFAPAVSNSATGRKWLRPLWNHRWIPLCTALALAVFIGLFSNVASAGSCEINVRLEGFGPGLSDYEKAVFELAAQATADEFGPCEVHADKYAIPFHRFWKELQDGGMIQAGISAGIIPQSEKNDHLIAVSLPFLGGALGLRKSIVRYQNAEQFARISDYEALKTYRVGQGLNWTDISVYRAAGIPVVDTFDLRQLFRMLEHKRFDHVPLSIFQVDEIFADIHSAHQSLQIATSTYIFYPIQTWFYFNRNDAALADRFLKGMRIILENGMEREYFTQHYGRFVDSIKNENGRIFLLDSPKLTAKENQEYTTRFLERFELTNYAVITPSSSVKKTLQQ